MIVEIAKKVIRVAKLLNEKPQATIDVRKEPVYKSKNFRGKHVVNYETCIGCDGCNKACPVDAIQMKKLPFKKNNIIPEVNLSVCIFCGLCEDACPTKPEKSIKLSGGEHSMLTGGTHKDMADFWVRVDVPQEFIDRKLEEEAEKERQKIAKAEARAKAKLEAEQKAKEEAESK